MPRTTTETGGTDVMESGTATEVGAFPGGFPYVRVGNGPENLVVLPGLNSIENGFPGRIAAWAYRLGFGRFVKKHAVYVVGRRRGMPRGYTTRDMAADCARALEELGPSCVMGFSTGGSVAQHLALDRPDLVTRLLLVVSAARLSEQGRRICERWRSLALDRRWPELHAEMAAVTVTGERVKRAAGAFMRVFGGLVLGEPSDPSDFVTTLEADLRHDTTERLGGISAPTLLVGGTEDPFFSGGILRETAEGIPGSTLRLYEGVGHGVPKERRRRYEDDALAFLDGRLENDPRRGSGGALGKV